MNTMIELYMSNFFGGGKARQPWDSRDLMPEKGDIFNRIRSHG